MGELGHVVLVGLMGSGKTTVGKLLAARLGRTFADNDAMLERRTGRSARDIAEKDGPDALHRMEEEVLVEAVAAPQPAVIAAAAATVMREGARRALAGSSVVYLEVAPEILASRVQSAHDDGHRPFVTDDALEVLRAQQRERDEAFRAIATTVVDASRPPAAVVDEITSALAAT